VANPVSAADFSNTMERLGVNQGDNLAVAVSGGADSMALAHLVGQWSKGTIHNLTVDHGLRPEAADEVRLVERFARSINAKCKKFKWLGDKSQNSIQESAREARYKMMAEYCRKQKLRYLLTAHHADDQMETILFRLAKGSGLDGLRGIAEKSAYDKNLNLLRPLLHVTHEECVATCGAAQIEWAEDPSNQSAKYMRGRMRASKAALVEEGLTAGRIGTLSRRIDRVLSFVEQVVEEQEKNLTVTKESKRIVFSLSGFLTSPEEVMVRLLQRAIISIGTSKTYGPRLEDVERLAGRMAGSDSFRGATLGGVKISSSRRRNELVFEPE